MAMLLLHSCADDPADSIYNPNAPSGSTPIINSIAVAGGGDGLAGVSTIVISGNNFSTDTGKIIVFFDAVRAKNISATVTEITVKAPNFSKDSVKIRVSIQGAELFSTEKYFDLKAAVAEFGGVKAIEEAYGIACDKTGNLYAAMASSGIGIGIRKYTPAGDTSSYAPRGGVDIWSGLKIGPAGILYSCRNQRAMYTISSGASPVLFVQKSGANFYDLDFDKKMNIWTGGTDDSVYSIATDKTIKTFFFKTSAKIKTVRIYNDHLYLGGLVDSTNGVWRAPIDGSGNLGTFQKYFDLSVQTGYSYNGPNVFAITFNKNGDMYVGTNGPDGVLLVKSDGVTIEKYYPGLFVKNGEHSSFAWGAGPELYISRRDNGVTTKTILKVNTGKEGAPYFGRGDL